MTAPEGRPAGPTQSPPGMASPTTDQELEQARAERDAALAKLDKREHRRLIGGRLRRGTVVLLVVLVSLLVPITATVTWVRHTVLNTDNYVSTVAPIASDPAVTTAAARIVTDQLFAALDPQQLVTNALPPKAAFLAAPITNGIKGFVQDQANNVLSSAAFEQIWTTANRVAHQSLMKVLNGDTKALQTTNGEVVLNLVPLLNSVLAAVQQQASDLLGKNITLPTLTGNELPSAACAKVSAALNRPLPKTCGQIPLFPAGKLDQAQHAVRLFKHLVVALLILTPILAALALWLTRRRRRTLMQMTVGVMLVMVLVRRTVMWLQSTLIDTGKPENKDARSAIVHQVLHGLFTVSLWVLWIAFAILVVAAVTGPYSWAVTSRGWLGRSGQTIVAWTRAGFGRTREAAAGGWVPAHLDLLRIAGAVLALLLILIFNLSFIGVLIVLALTAIYEFWLYQVGIAARTGDGSHPEVRTS